MLTNINKVLSKIDQPQKQKEISLDKLSIEQLQIAIESMVDPIAAKEAVRTGSVVDIKNYHIATEATSLTGLALKGLFKAIYFTYQLVKKLIKKIMDKAQEFKYMLKGFGQVSDSDTRVTNELLRNVGKVLPNFDKFKELTAEDIKALYKPEIKKFLISKNLDTPNVLIENIAAKIYSMILNLNTSPSARLLAGIGNVELYNAKILKMAVAIKEERPFATIFAVSSVLSNDSVRETEYNKNSYDEIADVILVKKSNPEPHGIDRESLYASTIDILKNGKTQDLYRRTYQAVSDMNYNKLGVLEEALETLQDTDPDWINKFQPIEETCSLLVNYIPKYLAAYSNTASFSNAFFSITKLIRTAKKEQGKVFGETKLIGTNYA